MKSRAKAKAKVKAAKNLVDLKAVTWPVARLDEALAALAKRKKLVDPAPAASRGEDTAGANSGGSPGQSYAATSTASSVPVVFFEHAEDAEDVSELREAASPATSAFSQANPQRQSEWVEWLADRLGIEAVPVTISYREIPSFLAQGGPALLRLSQPQPQPQPQIQGQSQGQTATTAAEAAVSPSSKPSAGEEPVRLLAVVGCRRNLLPGPGQGRGWGWLSGHLTVLGPDLKLHYLRVETVQNLLAGQWLGANAPVVTQTQRLLDQTGLRGRQRERAGSALLRERLGPRPFRAGWLITTRAGASLRTQARHNGLPKYFGWLILDFIINRLLWVGSWWVLTTGLFQPHFEWSWLWLWAICILGQIPTGAWRDWLVGLISVKVGVIIKRRLMAGALALTPEEMRLEGIGSLLGRVIESEALESMSLAGGLMAVLSLIEIGTAAPVFLAAGPPGGRLLLLLAGYGVGMGGLLAWWLGRTRQRWVQHRLAMAQALVERLVGHRTRLAQESGSWHTEEDRLLADYFTFSRQMDRPAAFLSAALERGWLCLALLVIALGALLFDFDQGSGGTSLEQLGLLLGGTLLVYYPLQNLPGAIANLVAARVAFDQIAPIWKAATPTRGPAHSPDPKAARAFYFSLPQLPGAEVEAGVEAAAAAAAEKETSPASASAYALAPAPELARPGSGSGSGNEFNSLQSAATATGESARARARARSFGVVLEAHNLSYAYPARGETTLTVLNGCELQIKAGDQLLLQGASGGGKSTLIALLAGLRKPSAGTLLLGGLDLPTVGEQIWRKRVAVAPQFHENYVVTESLAFNLLLGRAWPPSEQDLAEALAVCQDLGLGDLLAKMPMGLFQIVGESGWQLSHGEKSRLFIARALLEGADLTILDESFAALDPQTLRAAMEGVRKRARTLLVVAHP